MGEQQQRQHTAETNKCARATHKYLYAKAKYDTRDSADSVEGEWLSCVRRLI